VVVQGRGRVVRLGKLGVANIRSVNLELDLAGGETDRTLLVSREELHGVVVVKLLNGTRRRDRALGLGDEHVLRRRREGRALVSVEVHELRVDLVVGRGESTPSDAKLNIVVLERHEGKRGLRILAKREAKRVELGGVSAVTVRGEGLGIRLREHRGGNLLGELGGVRVNHLTTDQKLDLLDLILPLIASVVRGRTVRDVHGPQEVTLTLEANGGHTVRGRVTLDNLTLDGLGEVRVTLVSRTEKGNLGLPDDVGILSTNSDELGNTTGHFILYYGFIFLSKSEKWNVGVNRFCEK